jgi:hypothetical protein
MSTVYFSVLQTFPTKRWRDEMTVGYVGNAALPSPLGTGTDPYPAPARLRSK